MSLRLRIWNDPYCIEIQFSTGSYWILLIKIFRFANSFIQKRTFFMKFDIEISVPNNGRCRENSRWDGIVLNGSGDVQISYSDGTCWLIKKKLPRWPGLQEHPFEWFFGNITFLIWKTKSLFTTKIGRVWDGPWLEIFHSSQTPKSKTSSYMVTPNCHTLHIYTVEYLKLLWVPLATSICMNLEILFSINI